MPPIKDDDDVNLDDIDTLPHDDNEPGPDDTDDDLPAGDDTDDTRDDQGDSEDEPGDGEQSDDSQPGEDEDLAARGRDRGDRQQPERRREGRENARVRTLNETVRQEREAREALQRRFDEYVANQRQPVQPRESEDQRQQRRALLSAEERMQEDLTTATRTMEARLGQATFQVQEASDKSSYEAKAAVDPLYKKWAPKVEAELARLRGLGANIGRQAILEWMVGKAGLESRGSKTNKTNEANGRRRLERQRVRSADTRNDATQSRRSGGKSLEDRLANQPL